MEEHEGEEVFINKVKVVKNKAGTMENTEIKSSGTCISEEATDVGGQHAEEPPLLQKCASQSDNLSNDGVNHTGEGTSEDDTSSAPVLCAVVAPEVDPDNALRSPPKLQPAIVMTKRKSDESTKTPFKPLAGSMKNTPASLSIIDAPSTKSVRSTRSSIDPTFAAKQRSFLNRVHNALSAVRIDDTSCESDPEPAPGDDFEGLSDDNEYVPGYEDIPVRRPSTLPNAGNKRRRDDTSLPKGKTAASANHVNSAHVIITDKESQEPAKKKKIVLPSPIGKDKYSDLFCWLCHREGPEAGCATCPRAYHNHCLRRTVTNSDTEWVCQECVAILKAENQETRSKALKMLTLDQLCNLLLFAVQRMKSCSGAADFEGPVDPDLVPTYHDYIVNPMHLSLLEKNIKKKCYGSTEAFVADATWLVHNSIIFNTTQSKLTSSAKNILRVCKQEMAEIENCPDCYNYSYTADDNWFIEICQKPHVLLWAKLKGFPYWPAKAMKCNSDSVDVRFFGAHDRAWVPVRDCYLYSQENPNPSAPTKPQSANSQPKKRNPKNNLDVCIEEVELHIQLLKEKFSDFQYAPLKMPVDPRKLDSHLKYMLPKYHLSECLASLPKKVMLQKRRSFELISSVSTAPVVKRMKADSSSTKPLNIIRLFKASQQSTPKETDVKKVILGDMGIKTSPSVSVTKNNCEQSSKICEVQDNRSIENGVHPPKENGDNPQSEQKINTVPITLNTVTPAQSHTFITPLKLPDATSIELRCKKKDARKIGLVDRIQEKISLWVSQGSNNSDGSNVDAETKSSKAMSPQGTESIKVEKKVANEIQSPCADLCREDQEEAKAEAQEDNGSDNTPNCEPKSLKRDLFASAKRVSDDSITQMLQSLTSKQPKIVLEKLILQKEKDQVTKPSIKDEDSASDDEEQEEILLCAQTGKKITVAEMKIISDNEDSDVVCNENSNSTLVVESVDSVTSTTPLSANSSQPTSESVSSVLIQPIQEDCVKATETIAVDSAPVVEELSPHITEEETKTSSELVKSQTVMNKEIAGKTSDAETKEDPLSESNPEVKPGLSKRSSRGATRKTDVGSKAISVEGEANKFLQTTPQLKLPQSQKPELKIFKSFKIRARPISELKDTLKSKFVPIAPKEDTCVVSNTQDAHPNTSNKANIDPDSFTKGRELKTLKSLLSNNAVTLRVEKPAESVKSDPGKSISVSGLVESKAVTPNVALSLSSTKTKTIVVQAGKSIMHIESPPKPTSTCIVTSATQRLVHGATSILKIKNPPESNTKVLLGRAEQAPAVTMHSISSPTVPPNKTSSAHKSGSPTSPTYVTVTQTVSGRPIVRRVLPSGITLSSAAKTVRVSGGKLSAMPDSVPHISEVLSKTPVSHVSAATVCSEQPAVTIQTKAGTDSPIETIASGEPNISASPQALSFSNVLSCKGPVSSELRSQANKMTDIFMSCLKDCLTEMGTQGSLEAQIRCLQLEMEHMQWRHQQEMEELRHNTELVIAEIRDRMTIETEHAVNIAVANAEKEMVVAVAATKEKQWCAFCRKEAMFYCCWNTSYCDHRCQQGHWPVHSLTCSQNTSSSVDHDHHPSSGNGQTQPAKMRRIVSRHKEGLTPPLLKKC